MLKKTFLLFALTLLFAALPASAQVEPVTLETGFTGPRAVLSPDGTQLAVMEDAGFAIAFETLATPFNTVINLYDASTGEQTQSLDGARDFVSALLFTPDSAQVLALLTNGDLLSWDAATGERLTTVRTPLLGRGQQMFWHPVTGALTITSPNFTHTTYVTVDPATGATTLLTFNPPVTTYGEWTALQDARQARIFNDIVVIPAPHSDALQDLPLAGDEVWTLNPQGRIALLSLGSGEEQVLSEGSDQPRMAILDLAVTESGRIAYHDTIEDTLTIVDLVSGDRTDIETSARVARLSPDGEQVAEIDADAQQIVLSAVEGSKTQSLQLPEELSSIWPLLRLLYTPDSSRLVVVGLKDADEQGIVLIYDL
jgi:WD40 repeat protein